jgi:hypothetical protein
LDLVAMLNLESVPMIRFTKGKLKGWQFEVVVMVFNATFNNISVVSWRSVLLVEETIELGEQF